MMTRKVSKASVKASLLKIRRLAVALVFLFAAQGVWGYTYSWTGNSGNGEWNTPGNWNSTDGGTTYPTTGDTAYITGNVTINDARALGSIYVRDNTTITVNAAVTATFLSMEPTGQDYVTDDFNVKITGTGSLTVDNGGADNSNAIILSRWSSTEGKIGTLEIDTTVECKQRIESHSGTQLLVNSGKTLKTKYLVHKATGNKPITKISIAGNLEVYNQLDLGEIQGSAELNNSGTIITNTITSTNAAYNNTGSKYLINNTGTIKVSSSFTIPAFTNTSDFIPYKGTGSIVLNGTNASFTNNYTTGNIKIEELQGLQTSTVSGGGHTTIVTADFDAAVQLNGTTITTADFADAAQLGNTASNTIENATFHDDITLSGANAFTSVTATGLGNHTLTVNAVQTIQDDGSVSLSGTDNSSRLTVTGNDTGNFALGLVMLNGNYLSLDTTSNVVTNLNGTAFAQNTVTTGSGSSNWIVTAAAEYVWNGGSGDWGIPANWLPPLVPGATDDVIINEGSPQINSDVTVNKITINGSGPVTVNNSKSLTISTGCELDDKIKGEGTLVLVSGQPYTVSSAKTLDINLQNNGTLTATAAMIFEKDFTNNGTATTSADITAKGSKWTNNGTFTASVGTVTFTTTSNTDTAFVEVKGDNTFYDVEFQRNAEIYGSNVVHNFTANKKNPDDSKRMGGRNIYIAEGKTLKVNGNLNLQGNSNTSGNRFRISCFDPDHSTYQWNLNWTGSGTNTIRYVSIKGCKLTGNSLVLENCTDFGGNEGWLFLNQTYEWTGASGTTDWDTAGNWSPASIPGKGSKVTIPEGKTKYPELTGALDLYYDATYQGSITIKAGTDSAVQGKLDIAGKNVKAGTITNNGLVRLTGAAGQNINAAMSNGNKSTVEYYGSGTPAPQTTNFAWDGSSDTGKQYNNLIINNETAITGDLVIAGNFTVNNDTDVTGSISVTGTSEINAAQITTSTTQVYNNAVTLGTANGHTLTGTVITFESDATINGEAALTLSGSTNNTLNANVGGTNPLTSLTVTGPLSLNCAEIKTTTQEYQKAVTLGTANAHILSGTEITFGTNATIKGGAGLTLSGTSDNILNADVGAGTALSSLSVTGPAYINCSQIKTSGEQSYSGAVTLGSTTELTSTGGNIGFTSTVSGDTLKINQSVSTSFNSAVNLTSLADTAAAGNITFKAGGSISSTTTLNTSGNISLTGTLETASLVLNNLVVDGDAVITTNGNQTYNGTINGKTAATDTLTLNSNSNQISFGSNIGQNLALSTLTVNGPAQIACPLITTSGSQTYKNTVNLAQAVTFTAKNGGTKSSLEFDGPVSGTSAAATSLTVDADTIIKTASITTNDNQIYKGSVSIQTDTELTSTGGDISFNSTLDGVYQISLQVPDNKTISVVGQVGNSVAPAVKIIQAQSTTFDGAVMLTKFEDTATAGNIAFNNGGTISDVVSLVTPGTVSFNNSKTFTFADGDTKKSFTHTNGDTTLVGSINASQVSVNNLALKGTITTTTNGIEISGTTTVNGNSELQAPEGQSVHFADAVAGAQNAEGQNQYSLETKLADVTFDSTVSKFTSLKTAGTATFSGNVTDVNTLTTSAAQINCSQITSSGAQNYSGAVTIGTSTELTSGGTIGFTSTVSGATLKIIQSGGTSFNGAVNLTSLADTAAAGNISLNAGGTIINDVNFATSGTVTLKGTDTDPLNFTGRLTHNTYNTVIDGTINAQSVTVGPLLTARGKVTTDDTQNYNGTVSLNGALTLESDAASAGGITFASAAAINGAQSLAVITNSGTNGAIFNANIGATTPLASLTVTGPVHINCTQIKTSLNQTYNDTVTIQKNTAMISENQIAFKTSITDGAVDGSRKKLVVNTPVFKSIANALNSSSVILGEIEFSQDTSIQTENTTAISFAVPGISGTGKTVTVESSVKELSFTGDVEFNPSLTTLTTGTGSFKASSGQMTFNANVAFADNTLDANGGKIILTADNIADGGFASLSGSNTFNDLTLTGSGKTFKIAAGSRQTVEGTLTLTGDSTAKLNLRSSTEGIAWEIKCTGANSHTIEYVDVKDGNNTSATGSPAQEYYLTAMNSKDSGNNTKWHFPNQPYEWTGATNTDWNTAGNWSPASVPGKGTKVTILEGKTKYPVLAAALDLHYSDDYKGSITIKAGSDSAVEGKLDIADKNVKAGTITNNGLVRLTGADGQDIDALMSNGTNSTVEYYGSGSPAAQTKKFAWDGSSDAGKQYNNLIINNETEITDDLFVAGKLTVNKDADITGSITVTGTSEINCTQLTTTGTQEYQKAVTLGITPSATHTLRGSQITFGTAAIINGGAALTLSGTTGNVLNANVGGTNPLTSLTVTGPLSLNCAEVKTSTTQEYQKAVTLGTANDHILRGTEITFGTNATIDGGAGLTLSGTSDNILNADVGDGTVLSSLSVTGPAHINCSQITTSDAQSYSSAVTLGHNTKLVSGKTDGNGISFGSTVNGSYILQLDSENSDIVFTGTVGNTAPPALIELQKAQNVSFNNTVTITQLSDTNTAGNININAGGRITNDVAFATEGTVTLKGTDAEPLNFTGSLTHNTYNTVIDGTINAQSLTVGPLTAKGKVTTADTQNYNGAVTLNDALTLKSNAASAGGITFASAAAINGAQSLAVITKNGSNGASFNADIGATTALASLTVTGPAQINCGQIKTSGNQTYNDALTLGISPSVTHTLSANQITFQNGATIDGAADLTLSGTTNNIVKADVGATMPLNALTITGPAQINCAQIITSGNQTYKTAVSLLQDTTLTAAATKLIKFESTLAGATGTESLTTADGDSQFNDTITNLAALTTDATATFNANIRIGSLQTQAANINCAQITTDSTQEYQKTVTLGTSPSETHTLSGSQITFQTDAAIDGPAFLILSGTTNNILKADVGATTPLTALTITGPAQINCAQIKTSENQTYKAAVSLSHDTTLTAAATKLIKFESSLTGAAGTESLTTADGNCEFNGEVTNLAALTTDATATFNANISSGSLQTQVANINCAQITTTGTQEYNGAFNLVSDSKLVSQLTGASGIAFNSNVNGNQSLRLEAENSDIVFAGAVGNTVPPALIELQKAQNVHFNGAVKITTLIDSTQVGDINFNAGGSIAAAGGQTFRTLQQVSFGNDSNDAFVIGTAESPKALVHTAGATSITGSLTAAAITLAQTSGGPMTINNSGLFTTTDGSALTYTTSFVQNGTGNSILGGSFGGTGNASFATNVQAYGSSAADFGAADTNINIGNNLIIIRDAAATDELDILSNVSVAENIVLYKGAVTLSANMTSGKDILILGSNYSTTDSSTGITDEYAYLCVRPATWSQPNYNEELLPDGNAVPGSLYGPSTGSGTAGAGSGAVPAGTFTSTLAVAPDKTLTPGKNFYANGTELSAAGATGQWILKLPDLTNAANAFAEAYFTQIAGCKVICSDDTSSDGTKARLICLECDDNSTATAPNTNVDFDDFEITAAWTERDNSIRVEFNRPVRYHATSVANLKFQKADGSPTAAFTGLYSDPDCQTEINYDTQLSYFYIKAAPQEAAAMQNTPGAWNTDATGKSSGAADALSTDRSGIHHQTKPVLDFPRALTQGTVTLPFILTDRWGKRLNNYSQRVTKAAAARSAYGSTDDSTNEVLDKTGPVLYRVRTGQELHTPYDPALGQAGEHSYDSHNFIEFLYSEKVDFNGSDDDDALNLTAAASVENIQVTDALGALTNSDITRQGSLSIAGLGIIQNGLLYTGRNARPDKYVNALYRTGGLAEYSVRLSLAGYTDPSQVVTDPDNYTYKKWLGYIENAVLPTGSVTHLVDPSTKENARVKDKAGNAQIKYADHKTNGQAVFDTIPEIDNSEEGLYGGWDLSAPVFAPVRAKKSTAWISRLFLRNYAAEAVGNNSGVGSTLDRIEFHLFDNTPEFDTEGNPVTGSPEWFTEAGWCNQNSDGEKARDLFQSYTYAADIFGGARPFDSDTQRRTSGGIRYSTLYSSISAFKYGIGTNLQDRFITTSFDTSKAVIAGASSLIFTGSSAPRRSAGNQEGLYFALPLANTSLDIKTSFTVKYDDTVGAITDLAGNRLRTKTFSTIDRTPPSIDMTVCPVGGDELQIIFVKELCVQSDSLSYNDNTTGEQIPVTEEFESLITECFDFITIDSSGNYHQVTDLTVDTNTPAKIWIKENQNGSAFTGIKLKLSRPVTLEDIKNKFIRITFVPRYGEESVDLFTGHPGSRVTFIQDENGNSLQMYTAHALSDFAVGIINPLYAYDSAMTEEDGTIISDSLFHKNLTDDVDPTSWAVHDWNRDQQNYGSLPAKRPVAIVADTSDGTEENENPPVSFRLYAANSPDPASLSTQYNKDLEPDTPWRIWLPDATSLVFTSLAEKNNTNYSRVDGSLLSDQKSNRLIFDLDQTIVNQWSVGNQISFLFGLTNSDGSPVTIMHAPELDINRDKQYLPGSAKMPLFALRQTDPADLLSLDLWSFRLKDLLSQRGGVTILNNVINASVQEKAVVKVDLPQDGNLTVMVMTLDGNIIDYLHRGSAQSGEHFFSWDGSNRSGKPVARGMYFIRVTGPGLDETRKVMVIKE